MKSAHTPTPMQEKNTLFIQGRDYWQQYINLNGYSFRPNADGLKNLSKNLDLNVPHLKCAINYFLEA